MSQRFTIQPIDVGNSLQNYIWILVDEQQRTAVAIDPTQADLVLDYCQQRQLILEQVWITHKHHDHIGGLAQLRQQTQAKIYVPELEMDCIEYFDHTLTDQDQFYFSGLKIDVIATAGHTLGHICFFVDELDALFSGDTLFAMGCGRIFEGTYAQMYHSLNRLAALPAYTKVYCAHEYTEANANFAINIEPDNLILQQRLKQVQQLHQQKQITLPSEIALELKTNPFLRCQNVEEFQKLRQLKDQF
ncbi:hydroxyacylglutathione hydrolase [Acinetobacter qingfengensis]|uniref:Hydroxyacylglutathione hydrolase n=1 Tax=Acinetobacter qingfengensis TaxID=1262585 RepID=A0A1E7REF8_9GAMM|nr:hydroxyacylglutathione hydrolase [Acinetobacter qingfengensis]KAA8734375.1 hydroxyacylglutathione hydrolase [Acinetobacter qingfengensis]OEY97617.1 hydroxyacylglutathione hydrolase [Acinetobacter qingfengensis]